MIISAVAAKAQTVVIDGNNVCIRASAYIQSDNIMAHANKGASFKYKGTYGSFYCIDYKGAYGFVHKSFAHVKQQKQSQPTKQTFAHVTGDNVRIRTAASLNAGVVAAANKGDYFVFLGFSGEWCKVKYGGKTRYIHADFVNVY